MMKNLLATILITATTGLNTIQTKQYTNYEYNWSATTEQTQSHTTVDLEDGTAQGQYYYNWTNTNNYRDTVNNNNIFIDYGVDSTEIDDYVNITTNGRTLTILLTDYIYPQRYLNNNYYNINLNNIGIRYTESKVYYIKTTCIQADWSMSVDFRDYVDYYGINDFYTKLTNNFFSLNYTKTYEKKERHVLTTTAIQNININYVECPAILNAWKCNLIFIEFTPFTAGTTIKANITTDWQESIEVQELAMTTLVTTTQEVIDLPNVLWTVLTMPFSFISQAFNLTIFEGTPYAFNFANLFLSIIGIMIFVWLLMFVIGKIRQ